MVPKRLSNRAYLFFPAVLVLVALLQISLAEGQDLTPWKGGGFGMFSRISKRNLTIRGKDASGQAYIINWQTQSRENNIAGILKRRILAMPSQDLMGLLAEQLFAASFVRVEPIAVTYPAYPQAYRGKQVMWVRLPISKPDPALKAANLVEVEIQIWQTKFDSEKKEIWTEPLSQTFYRERGGA
ncbi:MAG: hypothetical protein CMH60_06500 [Myxococcales bacterium]|nr:hypothetical protein [Myxococcales bacterium]